MNAYAKLLQFVIDNGRVLTNDDGTFQTESVEAEVQFEAAERNWSGDHITAAVDFALAHCKHS
jgi:energy-coupling factor transporter ATP-binding protein EcfA2